MTILFQIKICGITRPVDALGACRAGADAIGLNFYAKSLRYVKPAAAKAIVEAIDRFAESEHRIINKVGVFVNCPIDEIVATAEAYSLDTIQFHGDEQSSIINQAKTLLAAKDRNAQLIRAVRTQSGSSSIAAADSVAAEIEAWVWSGVDGILLDAAAPEAYGGTGKTVDWDWVAGLSVPVPLILAGGLNAENVAEAIRISGVESVDVASGVEIRPGIKDPKKTKAFVEAAKASLSGKR